MSAVAKVFPIDAGAVQTVPMVIEPLAGYNSQRSTMKGESAPVATDILQDVRDNGNWLPVATATVEKIVAVFIAKGESFPDEIALMDLHYWIDKGNVKTFRYYAKRWGWGDTKTRRMFERLGLLSRCKTGTQEGHNEDTKGTQESEKSEQFEGVRTQEGHNEDTKGTQYIQTKTTDSDNTTPLTPQTGGAPEFEYPAAKKSRKKRDTYRNPLADIERVYSIYPKKADKAAAFRAIDKALNEVTADVLVEAVTAYAAAKKDTPWRFIKNPATFFNGKCWEDDRATWNGDRTASGATPQKNGGATTAGRCAAF